MCNFLGNEKPQGLLRLGRRRAASGRGIGRTDEGPVGFRAQLFAQQDAVALSLEVDRDFLGTRTVAVADLTQVVERGAAALREGVPGFHRDRIQVVDELHAPTVSIDKVKVKQMLIYQMLKVRDNFRMNMYQHRRERLLALIDAEYGGERVRFCDKTGLSESRLAQLLSTTYRDGTAFTEKTARKVELSAGLPPLYFDQGAIDAPAAQPAGLPPGSFIRVEAVDSDDPRLTIIPKVRLRLTAGISGFEVEPEPYDGSTTTVPTDWIERRGYHRDNLIAIRVRGESMEPTFYEDDLVVINTADKSPVDGAVFAINYEGEPVVKRVSRDAGQWWLTSDNADQRKYHRKSCRGETCIIIGRVVRKETERF